METESKDKTTKHALPSGATLHMGRPPYKAAGDLRNALARAAGAKPLTADEMKVGFDALKENPSAGGAIVARILSVLSSEDVEKALFACLVQSTYEPKGADGARVKIDADLMDHDDFGDDARTDLYAMFIKVGGAAVGPFLGPLVSAYKTFLMKSASVQGSPSKLEPSAS